MLLSEHVCCVVIAFKMTERVGQWICIKFCIKLEHCSTKTIWMIQKATAMGSCWMAASTQQCAHSCIASCAVFWWNIRSPRWLSTTYSPDLVLYDSWLFPKLKSSLKGKRFQTIDEIQENKVGQRIEIGRTVWGPKVPIWTGTAASLSYLQCFVYLASSYINVSIFHITWLDTFWTNLV